MLTPQLEAILAEMKSLPLDDGGTRRFLELMAQLSHLEGGKQAAQQMFSDLTPERARALMAGTRRVLGTQRAKDLVDQADSEPDPRKAIKLLQRALKDGRTGIQAGKAYHGLGDRYMQVGKLEQAIASYTQAIDGGWPNPLIYFKRGELYYQQGQRDAARRDLEQALALDLLAPDRELATAYLQALQESNTSKLEERSDKRVDE